MDFVVRFNYFKIKNNAARAAVGSKTDLWFLSEMKSPREAEFDASCKPRQFVVPIAIPAKPGCSRKSPKRCRVTPSEQRQWSGKGKKVRSLFRSRLKLATGRFRIVPLSVLHSLRTTHGFTSMWPSTGLIAVIYVLNTYPDAKVYLHGYDFTQARKSDCPEAAIRAKARAAGTRSGGKGGAGREYICKSSALGHFWGSVKKSGTVHNMFQEGEVIRKLIRRGKVAWLSANSPIS